MKVCKCDGIKGPHSGLCLKCGGCDMGTYIMDIAMDCLMILTIVIVAVVGIMTLIKG